MKPRLLDLFCCEGGASTGYSRAGFQVYGVDLSGPSRNINYGGIMTGVEVTLTLGYPDSMDEDAVRVAVSNLTDALGLGFEDVPLLSASVRRLEEDSDA